MSNQTIANRTLENKGVLYDLISLVYKHNGRVGNQVFKALVQMHLGQEPADIFEHAVFFKFAKISDLKSFSNELGNSKNIHIMVRSDLGDYFYFDLGKYITFDTFAECQEKNPNIKLQDIIEDSGKYKTLVRAFCAKAVLEPCPQFRYPFCEQMSRFTKHTISYPSNWENLKNKKLTINYDWFVQNYKQFDNENDAIEAFCKELARVSLDFDDYVIYSHDTIVPRNINAYQYGGFSLFFPFVKAELAASISKQYTKEQAKKDYEKGRELIEQGNALVATAMAFYTSQA